MKIQIVNDVSGLHGTKVLIDGKEVPQLHKVTLDHKSRRAGKHRPVIGPMS